MPFPLLKTLGGDMHSSLDIKKTISHCITDGEDNSPIVTAFPRDELKKFRSGFAIDEFLQLNFFFKT
jgi:hypothetical protein